MTSHLLKIIVKERMNARKERETDFANTKQKE